MSDSTNSPQADSITGAGKVSEAAEILRKAKPLVTQFENALCELVERYLCDGLLPSEVTLVLKSRADDDFEQFAKDLSAEIEADRADAIALAEHSS